jgi:hypothetical protein
MPIMISWKLVPVAIVFVLFSLALDVSLLGHGFSHLSSPASAPRTPSSFLQRWQTAATNPRRARGSTRSLHFVVPRSVHEDLDPLWSLLVASLSPTTWRLTVMNRGEPWTPPDAWNSTGRVEVRQSKSAGEWQGGKGAKAVRACFVFWSTPSPIFHL